MSTLFIILIIITSLLITALGVAFLKDDEGWIIGLVTSLLIVGIFGWLIAGIKADIKTITRNIPKNKIEILVGRDKIVVSSFMDTVIKTEIFRDAKTFNAVTIDKDSSFLINYHYNLYNYIINSDITKK